MNLFLRFLLFFLVTSNFVGATDLRFLFGGKQRKEAEITRREVPPVSDEHNQHLGFKFNLVLPTKNREIFGDPSRFYMHTNRYVNGVNIKPWQGGTYGFSRNPLFTQNGKIYTKLHEGIDVRPLIRDDKNIPLDDIYTMAEGTVVYVNDSASRSNYGKYVVVRHDWPEGSFYSLYAHLAATSVVEGQAVRAGDILGRLGYTGVGLDRERAHLHVEFNFLLSDKYDSDYSPGNGHKNFNGLNLVGMDLGRFIKEYHINTSLTIKEFLAGEEPYFRVKSTSGEMPGILKRHPWLGTNLDQVENPRSWEFTFARTGVPLSISPCQSQRKHPEITWVKSVDTCHSNMTMGRLSGSGTKTSLTSRGSRFVALISESF